MATVSSVLGQVSNAVKTANQILANLDIVKTSATSVKNALVAAQAALANAGTITEADLDPVAAKATELQQVLDQCATMTVEIQSVLNQS